MSDGENDRPGEQALRLDAERTRDELVETIDELERRLAPGELLASARRAVRRRPAAFAGAAIAVAGLVAGAITLGVRRG